MNELLKKVISSIVAIQYPIAFKDNYSIGYVNRTILKEENEITLTIETQKIYESEYKNYDNLLKEIIKEILNIGKRNAVKHDYISNIIYSGNLIAINTRRGVGNFIITSNTNINKIMSSELFKEEENYSVNNITYKGKFFENMLVFQYDDEIIKDKTIVGYIRQNVDSGLILSCFENKFNICNIKGAENYYQIF